MKRTSHNEELMPDDTVLASTAPYNFISLPMQYREDDQCNLETAGHDIYAADRLSGWIDLHITSLTDLYIRGSHTIREYSKMDDNGNTSPQTEFFQPAEVGRIPGSSLRGMVRNLVEIISESRTDDITKKTMFYRTMDGSSLSKHYTDQTVSRHNGAYASNISAGYIFIDRGVYKLYPAQLKHGLQFFRIEKYRIKPPKVDEWARIPVWFIPNSPTVHHLSKSQFWHGSITEYHMRNLSKNCSDRPAGEDWEEGWLIISGSVDRKHMHWIVGPMDQSKPIPIPDDVIKQYKSEGLTKDIEDNNFSILPNIGDRIPCFYKCDAHGNVYGIGHTGMFRLPYMSTPGDLISSCIPCADKPGLAEGIFGTSADKPDAHSSFVFFEDAVLSDSCSLSHHHFQPKVLGEPHPTAFPHYVCQDRVEEKEKKRKNKDGTESSEIINNTSILKHWDSPDATPRGTKLYWHRKNEIWKEEGIITKSHPYLIEPANSDTVFHGRVRFDNLTKIQLGALLLALKLPTEEHAHKLGMCKPYGMGSVRIDCTLFLTDRGVRYTKLFENNSLVTGSQNMTKDIANYQTEFARWMGYTDPDHMWSDQRMQELSVMLNFAKAPTKYKTEYLIGPGNGIGGVANRGQFGERRVLPGPLQIVDKEAKPIERNPHAPDTHKAPISISYSVGQQIKAFVIDKTEGMCTVKFEDGAILEKQWLGQIQSNPKETVKMFIEEIVDGRITKVTRKRL